MIAEARGTLGVLARAETRWSDWGRRMAVVTLPVALDAAVRALHQDMHSTGYHRVGLVLLGLAWLVAVGLQRSRLPTSFVWVVPLAVLAAIGFLRLVPEPSGVGIMVVIPAMWLGIDKRMRGVVVAGVGVLVTQGVPALLYFGAGPSALVGSAQLLLVVLVCSVSLAWIADQWGKHEKELDQQRQELSETWERLTAGQRLNNAVVTAVDVGLVALQKDGAYTSMNPHHQRFMKLAYPDGHGGYAGQTGWVFEPDGSTFLTREKMPTIRARNGEEYNDYLIWVGEDPAQRRALAVSAQRVEGDEQLASVLVYKDVTDLMRALKVKDEFLATVSHELRTPLTSIIGYLDLALVDSHEDDPQRGYLLVVHRNARRLLRLVNDLLLTARTDRGVLDLDQRAIDFSRVVSECLNDLGPRADDAAVRIDAHLVDGVWVCGDRERLAEVIDNLLTNAVKYSHAGGAVRVNLFERAEDGERTAVLTVADHGIGITEEEQRQLFTKFFRTQEAQERAIQGVGLGLSISKSIVEGHDGSIGVSSAPGVGTTFTVLLPAVAGPEECDPEPDDVPGTIGAARS
jgi:two-component system phosphate regulon sensor histidine kinase PhoR